MRRRHPPHPSTVRHGVAPPTAKRPTPARARQTLRQELHKHGTQRKLEARARPQRLTSPPGRDQRHEQPRTTQTRRCNGKTRIGGSRNGLQVPQGRTRNLSNQGPLRRDSAAENEEGPLRNTADPQTPRRGGGGGALRGHSPPR